MFGPLQEKVDAYLLTKQEAVDIFVKLKRKTAKNSDRHELCFKDFAGGIRSLENELDNKLSALKRKRAMQAFTGPPSFILHVCSIFSLELEHNMYHDMKTSTSQI